MTWFEVMVPAEPPQSHEQNFGGFALMTHCRDPPCQVPHFLPHLQSFTFYCRFPSGSFGDHAGEGNQVTLPLAIPRPCGSNQEMGAVLEQTTVGALKLHLLLG